MQKNVKSIFFVATLLILLVGITTISASDVTDDNTILSNNNGSMLSDVTTTTTNENKIVDKHTKNIKTEEQSTDYYVSDSSGSDDNTGTNTSPFKTLQGALDKTTSDGTYNIHIAEGTYKGLGNTNLTLNGNYNINIIGEGMNKTVFDGEAKYTISGGTAWGSDDYWNPYNYQNANYFLTIIEGTGHITLSNFNIEHMASIGGTNIGAYPHATIDNYANLTVDNIFFYYNMAGVGSAIRNHRSGTVLMTNCLLTENRKSSSSGNDGAIYNNGTITIENTIFDHNAGRWGVILNDYILNIKDSTMKNGISYDLGSTYKFGSGIASNSGQADFFNSYKVEDVQTTITNVTFENNGQTDIYQGVGTLIVNNCNFINSTGIYINSYVKHDNNTPINMTINGSTFKDMKPSSYFGSLSVKTGTTFGIYSDGNYQLLIENNTIELPEKGYGIYTTENSIIRNNNLNSHIVINGNNNTVSNNTINTTKEAYSIELSPNSQQNTITDNILYSSICTGTKSIKNNTKNNIILDNTPETGDEILLNNENYNEYFDENGLNIPNKISNGSIVFVKSLNNKNINLDNVKLVLTMFTPESNLNNVQIKTNPNAKIYLTNMNINNNNSDTALIINSSYNTINNITINTNTSKEIITIEQDHNTLDSCNINTNLTNTNRELCIILVKSSNNELTNMVIKLGNVENMNNNITMIDIQNNNNNKIHESSLMTEAVNSLISTNIIGVNSKNTNNSLVDIQLEINRCENVTGINCINSTNTIITSSQNINSNNMATGIYVDSSYNTYIASSITVNSDNGKAITINNSNNTTITTESNNFNIMLFGYNSKAIELNNSNYTTVRLLTERLMNKNDEIPIIDIINSNNNIFEGIDIQKRILTDGSMVNNASTFIRLTNSSNNIISNYITGEEEVKTILTTNNTLIELNNSNNNTIREIEASSGLPSIIINNSVNNRIINNTIKSENNYTILLNNSNNNMITNNEMYAMDQTLIGDYTVLDMGLENIIENNTPGRYYLTNENYDDLFTDSTFIHDYYSEIILSSDIDDKELIFPEQVTIYNPEKYTLYNSILTINGDNTIVNDLIINSSKSSNIITITGDNSIFNNIDIYHENEDIVRSIINKAENNVTFNNLNITSIGAEIETNDNIPSLISIYSESELKLNNSNINTTYKSCDNKGTTNSIYSRHITINSTTINTLGNNMAIGLNTSGSVNGLYATVKGNTTAIGTIGELNRHGMINNSTLLVESNDTAIGQTNSNYQYIHTTVLAKNLAIGIYEVNNTNLQIAQYNANITIKSNNTAYGAYLKDSGTIINQMGKYIYFNENCTMDISGINVTGVYAENLNCPGLNIHNNMTLTGTNVQALYTNNLTTYNGITITYAKITTKQETDTTPISINNLQATGKTGLITIQRNQVIIKNYTLTNPIIDINDTNAKVTVSNNFLISNGVCGDNAISITNSGKITKKNNTPTDLNSLPVKIETIGLNKLYRDANNITFIVTNYNDELMNGTLTLDFGAKEQKFENLILENGTVTITFTPNATEVLYQYANDSFGGIPFYQLGYTRLNLTMTYTTTPPYQSPQTFTKNNIQVYPYKLKPITVNNTNGITHIPKQITAILIDELNRTVNEGTINYYDKDNNLLGQSPVIDGISTINVTFNNTYEGDIILTYIGEYLIKESYNNYVKFNITSPELIVNPVTATVGETINISANITAFGETVTDINMGKVVFKVNGKTLKDANGKVIYAKVVNGIATIENYLVPESWNKDNLTIEAVYSGSSQCDSLRSEKQNITINKEPTFTTNDITAKAGDTITLKATITDGNKVINSGKVVFKINGKTVKDANGKTIYAKVVKNQANVTYTLPSNMKAKDYNITATFISSDYERLEDVKTLTITA